MNPKKSKLADIIAATLRHDRDALISAIAQGADINQADKNGRTALHHTAIDGSGELLSILLSSGADANLADHAGWTALHFAANEYHVEVAEILLKAGANVDSEDSHGNTPLFRAVFASQGRGEMIHLLRRYGAQLSHVNKHGVSPIGLAESIANYDVSKWFN